MNFNKYNMTILYKTKEDFTTVYMYKNGKLVGSTILSEFDDDSDIDYSVCEKVFDEKKYIEYQKQLDEQIKHDMLEDVGLLNHPKANRIYAYAWDKGHSLGYSEVYNVLCDLADLFLY